MITRDDIDTIPLKGRDVLGMLTILPGVVDTNPREAPSWNLLNGLTINGRTSFNLTYDGVNNKETESNFGNLASPALDSIAEVRVQTSNFQAEYGRSSGASITLITRSGSKDFRGSAAFYKRDTALNGNEFSRRQQCGQGDRDACEPPLYRFDNFAWTLGGPVLVPGTELQLRTQPAVLLLVAGSPRPHGSRCPHSAPDAHGAGAYRRFLADGRHAGATDQHP